MNQIVLTGNIVRDIEVKTANEKKVISNCIAVSRDRKNASGEYESDFFNFVTWEKQAEYLEKYGHKGDRAEIVGRLQTRKYKNKDGVEQTVVEVMVEKISVFSKQPAEATKASVDPNSIQDINEDDDLPF